MVKTGLISAVIVSQWTWAATILQSSNVAWLYGESFWTNLVGIHACSGDFTTSKALTNPFL